MEQDLTIHKILDYIEFNINRETKSLCVGQLQEIDLLFQEIDQYLPEIYDVNFKKALIRKKILDTMNNSLRQTKDHIEKIKKII